MELEGSSMGKRLYEYFGFKTDYEVSSFSKTAEEFPEENSITVLEIKDLQDVIDLDAKAFGASRAELLKKITSVAQKNLLVEIRVRSAGDESPHSNGSSPRFFKKTGLTSVG